MFLINFQFTVHVIGLISPGTGESGKSTFIKQMRIIHGQGYSKNDRLKFKVLVYRNIYTAIQALIEAMELLKIPFEVGEEVGQLMTVRPDDVLSMAPGDAQIIAQVWKDKRVQECYERRREYQLSDSAK